MSDTLRMMVAGAIAALLALVAGSAPGVAPAIAAPAHPAWTQTVVVTPAGGHLLGNPAARVKLIEYISYTCPHCANFERQSNAALQLAYVQPGKVSVEVRNLVRDPVDMTVAMLTNCGPPARFFANHAAFLTRQDEWMKTLQGTTDAQRARWGTGAPSVRYRAIAGDLGFYRIMEQRGYGRAEADRCLADSVAQKRIVGQRSDSDRLGINATPSFLIDGTLLAGTADWAVLEPQLKVRL